MLFFKTLSIVSFKVRGKGSLALATTVKDSAKIMRASLEIKIFFMNRKTPKRERVETIL